VPLKCRSNKIPPARRLLVLDSSFSLEAILARGLEYSVTCRDLEGFFEHVWTVHPFATIVTTKSWTSRTGQPELHTLSPEHTFIEGKVGRFFMLRGLSPLNFIIGQIGIFISLMRLIRKERISVVRVGDPLYLGLFGWALSRLCKIPLVVRVGGNHDKAYEITGQPIQPRFFFTRKIEKIVERFVFKRADLVACVNEDNLDFALLNGARVEFSTIFRYGNLINKLHFTEPLDRPDGRALMDQLGVEPHQFLLYIGRLERVKLPGDVVRVLAEVRKCGHDVKAIMVGDGQLRAMLEELALELEVEDQVVFCGNKDQAWLAKMIPLAATIVSPITGRSLSEAALGAAPIVAYDVDWQGELIQTGITGELVPDRAWKKMADAVEHFLIDSDYAQAMGNSVRQRALKMLDPTLLNQHERDQYTALLYRF